MTRPPQLSIAPCITCTSCDAEVPISRFGEHACGGAERRPLDTTRTRIAKPLWAPSPAIASIDNHERLSDIQPLEEGYEDFSRSLHSYEGSHRRTNSTTRSASSRTSSVTFGSSVGRSSSTASSALSSVSADSAASSSSWPVDAPPSKNIDQCHPRVAARTHTRQFSASSVYSASGQASHSRNSSVGSGVVSREDGMYRAHPSCMEDRVSLKSQQSHAANRLQHHRAVSSQDGQIDGGMLNTVREALVRVCRGCLQPIAGKAIKDGQQRLSGYWHKACFSCNRCCSPFATADIFVIDDLPYCEQHYHELNGSLCTVCRSGIEGPCLETPQGQRFHPHCLKCKTCNAFIVEGFADGNGRLYCEQHGLARMQREAQGLPSKMQRRTTRMLMI